MIMPQQCAVPSSRIHPIEFLRTTGLISPDNGCIGSVATSNARIGIGRGPLAIESPRQPPSERNFKHNILQLRDGCHLMCVRLNPYKPRSLSLPTQFAVLVFFSKCLLGGWYPAQAFAHVYPYHCCGSNLRLT
jgi:hypothetical protein